MSERVITAEVATAGPDVLIVEDNPDVRSALDTLVTDAGFVSMTAVNGVQALRFAALWPPRLVLLDIHMPVMDGREFLDRRCRDAALSCIPVIVLSSEPMDPVILDRVQHWLPKPDDPDRILAAIGAVLGDARSPGGPASALG